MATTADVHRPYNKHARMPKKGSSTDEMSDTKSLKNLQLLFERLEQVLSLVEPAKVEIVDLQKRISCNQEPTEEKLQSQLLEAKHENEKLLHDVMEIRKEKSELQRANLKLQALEKEQRRKENFYTEQINAFKDATQKMEERLQKALKDHEETNRLRAQQETELRTKLDIQSQEKARLLETNQNLKAERDKLETDLSNTKTKLSKLMSDKLSDNNPNIAYLIEHRPTKIAEKYQELFDNEWTDACEVAEKHFRGSDEKTLVSVLRKILMDIHEFCEEEFSKQENALLQALYRTDKVVKDQPHLAIKTQLKDLKRRVAKDGIENINEKFIESAYKSTRFESFMLEVKDFVHECVKTCWLMVLQGPPFAFHTDVRKGDKFDSNRYKAFTVTGTLIDFIVWPPLLLQKDGSVLTKGIVQCKKLFDASKSVRTRSRQVSASVMGISTGYVRLPVKDSRIDTTKWLQDKFDKKK